MNMRAIQGSIGCAAIFSLLMGAAVAMAGTNTPAFALAGDQLTAGRLTFQIGPNALPAQIVIATIPGELPLESRKPDAAKMSDQDLQAMGRGPQLVSPMRLEATMQGKVVILAPTEAAQPAVTGEKVVCKARLSGGGVNAVVESEYASDGALGVKVTYGGGAKVDALALVMEMNGVLDTVVNGGAPFKGNDYGLAENEGLLWGNAAPAVPAPAGTVAVANRGAPGVPSHLFWGSGDRGFTWLSDNDSGWTVVPAAPVMTLVRSKGGSVIWRASLVNQPAELKGDKTVAFTLLTHPAMPKAANGRRAMWLEWPFAGKAASVLPLTAAGRSKAADWVRADGGSVYESKAAAIVLEGPAGGDAASATNDLAMTYPIPIFRYLAGTHLGVNARLNANAAKLIRPGMDPACDRMVIGRALLHDIGIEPAGVAHLAMAVRAVSALAEFGYFEADGKTEFLPYWRNQSVLRYGEVFTKGVFEETVNDPMTRVHVSAWRRPSPDGKAGTLALILIVNESDQPVREQFYVLDPVRLFGGPNMCKWSDLISRWDVSSIPKNSDWQHLGGSGPALLDVEDGDCVGRTVAKNGQEVYSRIFIPAHGFRLLLGGAAPKAKAP